MARSILYGLLPNGKAMKGYGTHRMAMPLLQEDWMTLFKLLGEGQTRPIIAAWFPLLEAARADELMGSGRVAGNVVLLSPDLL